MIILMLRMIILMGQDDGPWLMAHGSRLKAHGSWPRGAGPTPEPRGAAAPGRTWGRPPGLQVGPAPLGHEP